MPSVHISALTFNNKNILDKTELRRSHRHDTLNMYHQQLNTRQKVTFTPTLWQDSSVTSGVEVHQRLFENPSFLCPATVLYPRAYQCIQRTHRLKWWDCPLQKQCWLLSNSLYFIWIHVSLDLFLYYRWYHIIREGKQTHWSAVSRIIPTALFVDGKGIFSSLLPVFWDNISL